MTKRHQTWFHSIAFAALAAACSSPTPPDQVTPALASVSISPTTVTAGAHATGTVTLTAPALGSGAAVTLSSNASDRATVASSTTVVGGATSATFDIATLPGATTGTATITGTLLGVTQSAILTVNAAVAAVIADFTVTPRAGTAANPGQCAVFQDTQNGQLLNELRCTFDGSASSPANAITEYLWTLPKGASDTTQFTGKTLVSPTVPCGTFAAAADRQVTLRVTAPGGTNTATKTITFIKSAPC